MAQHAIEQFVEAHNAYKESYAAYAENVSEFSSEVKAFGERTEKRLKWVFGLVAAADTLIFTAGALRLGTGTQPDMIVGATELVGSLLLADYATGAHNLRAVAGIFRQPEVTTLGLNS